jgi:signal transduction histidine kinase
MPWNGRNAAPSPAGGPRAREHDAALAGAETRARTLAAAAGGDGAAAELAAHAFAADAIASLVLDGEPPAGEVDAIVHRLAALTGLTEETARLGLHLQVVRDPRLLGLPPLGGVEAIARTLLALAPVESVCIFAVEHGARLRCAACVGEPRPSRRTRASAWAAFHGRPEARRERGEIQAVPVRRWQQVVGVVAVRARLHLRERALAYLQEAAPPLWLLFERAHLLERSAERERSLVEAGERRLTRLGYDLHDGPLQDVGAALRELRRLRGGPAAPEHALAGLEEILAASERSLRELAQSVEAPGILSRPFRATIEQEVAAFVRATDVHVTAQVEGDFDGLSASQRIALIRIVQEALTNVREHSGAGRVRIALRSSRERVQAEVADDGRGFDVERTLIAAARRGRLGLVGMSERVRLLGGRLELRSRPGESTVVSVTLPPWRLHESDRKTEATAPRHEEARHA